MGTQGLHRGRPSDHIQLVAADIEASRSFYRAVFHGEAERSAESVKNSFRSASDEESLPGFPGA